MSVHCSQCGNPIQNNTTVCSSCGHPVHNELAASVEQPVTQQGTHPYVEKGAEASKNYWNFIVQNLKSPASNGEKTSREQFVHGYVNLSLLAFFFGLGGYFHLKEMYTGFFAPSVPFFKTFFTLFFYGAASSLVTAGALLLVILFLMNTKIHFHDVIARFGALTTVPLLLMAFYFFSSLVGLDKLSTITYLFILVGLLTAIIITLYSFRNAAQANFDLFYGLMIVFAILGLYLWITNSVLTDYVLGLFIPKF